MKRRMAVVALMGCTALTPTPARAEPVSLFVSGFIASIGASATTAAVATALGGASAAGFAAGSFLFGTALGGLVLSVGLSAIARALTPKPKAPATISPSDRLVNFAQPISVLEWVFGQVRKGGPYAITSFQKDRRHYSIILAAHEITAIDQWYIDQQPVEVSGGLVTTSPFGSNIGLRPYLGAQGQAADSIMVSAIPEWTTAHDMAGLAHVAAFAKRVKDKDFSEVYGNSPQTGPAITPVFRGVKVYDPRSDTTEYSNNAALIWAWATENRMGEGIVDWGDVAVEADAADVFITNRDGGTQRKWTLNGTFGDDVDYQGIVEQIILACDGYVYEKPDGTVGFYVGRYIEPTITLTEEDFFGFEIAENDFGQDPVTEFVGRYVEPANDWQESPSATWKVDPDARINRQAVSVYYSNSHNQTMRVLKRTARANRAQFSVQGQIGIIALELLKERFVDVDILGRQFVAEIGSIKGTDGDSVFEITLTSVEPEDFEFDAATEEPLRPARDQVTNDNTVEAPTGLSGAAIPGPGIEWTWNAQAGPLNQEFRFRQVGETGWQPSFTINDDVTDLITPGLVDGQSYEAELRNITGARRPSAWVQSGTVVAIANSTPPDPVTNLTATGGVGTATIEWETPNDPNHDSTRIYRATGTGAAFSTASLVATVFGPANIVQSIDNSGLAPETYVYWAASTNASGVESTLAGPEEATVT